MEREDKLNKQIKADVAMKPELEEEPIEIDDDNCQSTQEIYENAKTRSFLEVLSNYKSKRPNFLQFKKDVDTYQNELLTRDPGFNSKSDLNREHPKNFNIFHYMAYVRVSMREQQLFSELFDGIFSKASVEQCQNYLFKRVDYTRSGSNGPKTPEKKAVIRPLDFAVENEAFFYVELIVKKIVSNQEFDVKDLVLTDEIYGATNGKEDERRRKNKESIKVFNRNKQEANKIILRILLEKTLPELKIKFKKFQEENVDLNAQHKNLESFIKELKSNLEQAEFQGQKLVSKLSEYELQNKSLGVEFKKNQQELYEQNQRIEDLSKQLQIEREARKEIHMENDQNKELLQQKDGELNKANQNIQKLLSQLHNSEEFNEKIKAENEQIQLKLTQKNEELVKAKQTINKEYDENKNILTKMEVKLEEERTKNTGLMEELKNEKKLASGLSNENNELREKIQLLQKENEKVKNDLIAAIKDKEKFEKIAETKKRKLNEYAEHAKFFKQLKEEDSPQDGEDTLTQEGENATDNPKEEIEYNESYLKKKTSDFRIELTPEDASHFYFKQYYKGNFNDVCVQKLNVNDSFVSKTFSENTTNIIGLWGEESVYCFLQKKYAYVYQASLTVKFAFGFEANGFKKSKNGNAYSYKIQVEFPNLNNYQLLIDGNKLNLSKEHYDFKITKTKYDLLSQMELQTKIKYREVKATPKSQNAHAFFTHEEFKFMKENKDHHRIDRIKNAGTAQATLEEKQTDQFLQELEEDKFKITRLIEM